MAKYYGKIGFLKSDDESEDRPSRYIPVMEERYYSGDLMRSHMSRQSAEKTVDDYTIDNEVSIVADPYALNNFSSMKYVEIMGTLWKVRSVSVEYPRLKISFGGLYNGPKAQT